MDDSISRLIDRQIYEDPEKEKKRSIEPVLITG